jgi:hypothetical protein
MNPVQILTNAARSPIGAAFAAAVAEVKRADQRKAFVPTSLHNFDVDTVKQLFTPMGINNNQQSIWDFLVWVASSCGKAAGKNVITDAYVGEIPINAANPKRADGVEQSDALLFINYTSNGNDTAASFAISKPRKSLSPDGRTESVWTVFSKTAPSPAYQTRIREISGDQSDVLWVPAVYDSLASLVNDILAHLVYEGRPPSYALWSGSEVPRALAMAGLHALGERKVFATIEFLNVCGYGVGQRKPAILVNSNAPLALPSSKSLADFERMYGTSSQTSGEPTLKKRKKTSVWATNVEKALKTWKKAPALYSRETTNNLLTMVASEDPDAYRFLYQGLSHKKWNARDILEDISYALLTLTLGVPLGDGDKIAKNQNAKNLLNDFKTIFSDIGAGFSDQTGLVNVVTSALFYGMFFDLLSSNDSLDGDLYEKMRGEDGSEFLYTAMMHGLDQFVDLGVYETALGHALSKKDVLMFAVQRPEKGISDVLNAVRDFISENSESIGSTKENQGQAFIRGLFSTADAHPLVSIGGLFSNANAPLEEKDEMIHAVFRIVSFSALLMALSAKASAGNANPIMSMVWTPRMGLLNPVPRMGHFWVRNKISGGRRGSTTAAAALKVLREFGKTEYPTDDTVTKSLPESTRTYVKPQTQYQQPQPQQTKTQTVPQPQYQQYPPQPRPAPQMSKQPPSNTPPTFPAGGRGGRLSSDEMTKLLGGVASNLSNLLDFANVLSELLNNRKANNIGELLEEAAEFNLDGARAATSAAEEGVKNVKRVINALKM